MKRSSGKQVRKIVESLGPRGPGGLAGPGGIWKGLLFLLIFAVPLRTRAEHFDFILTVENGSEKVEARSDDDPPAGGYNPRPVLHGHTGETLHWQFFMTNAKPHDPFVQLKVRYYLAPEAKAGQKQPSAPGADPIVQGEFIVDMNYKDRVGVRQEFHVDKPGIYLLRVESANSHSDHEHFSAVDVEIK
jgi:hypothetical protein